MMMGIFNVKKIVEVFNILMSFLFQSFFLQMIHLLFIAAMTGLVSRKIFIPAYENIEYSFLNWVGLLIVLLQGGNMFFSVL